MSLELELGEEPLVLSLNVSQFELFLNLQDSSLLLCWVSESLLSDETLEVHIDTISSRHQVLEVVDSDEWLHVGSHGDLLLAHSLGDSLWVLVNTSNDGMREWLIFSWFIEVLDDDSLSACISSLQNDNNLTGLQAKILVLIVFKTTNEQ